MDILLYEKPLKVELSGNTLFVNGNQHPRTVRTIKQMAKTLMRQVRVEELEDFDMYYMYRGIVRNAGMRFDITVIPAKTVGNENAKTFGHYHPRSEDGLAYPEVYQVLHGKAVFIMQKRNRNGSVDVSMVNAKEKDVVLLPPGYGHVSINPDDTVLVLANLVYDRFESIYYDFEESRGAAYYYLKGGEIAQNTNYIIEGSERIAAPELCRRYGFSCSDLLAEFFLDPGKFAFLEKPHLLFKA